MVWFKWFGNKRKKKAETAITLQDVRKEKEVIKGFCFFCACRSDYPNEEDRRALEEIARRNNQKVEWLESIRSEREERLREALIILSQKKGPFWLKRSCDYAWIKLAIDRELVSGLKKWISCSSNAFIQHIEQLEQSGLKELPDDSELRKYYKKAVKGIFPWHYTDCEYKPEERTRRNGIARRFKELMEA